MVSAHRVGRNRYQKKYKKVSFPFRIYSVNVTKPAANCGFGHIYLRNPEWKTYSAAQLLTFILIYVNDFDTVRRNMGDELEILLNKWESFVIPLRVQAEAFP